MSAIKVRVSGYSKPDDPDAKVDYDAKVDQEIALVDQFAFIELEYAGAKFRISPASADDRHGIEGIEIMECGAYSLAVRPIVSNVVVVTKVDRS